MPCRYPLETLLEGVQTGVLATVGVLTGVLDAVLEAGGLDVACVLPHAERRDKNTKTPTITNLFQCRVEKAPMLILFSVTTCVNRDSYSANNATGSCSFNGVTHRAAKNMSSTLIPP